jgi:outer membrane protein assembly factor BamD
MLFRKKIFSVYVLLYVFMSLTSACVEKSVDPTDPAAAFARAREPYDDEMYEIAIQRLGEFKSRYPYSKHAPEAEILIANSQYAMSRYAEAASSYEQFVKLHPRHEQAAFAQFRVGESYWAEAPDDIDREQDYTLKAIAEWEKLVTSYPQSEESKKAKNLLDKGRRRVAEHSEFIAKFYCKQEIYHACAYRYLQLTEQYPQFSDLVKKAYTQAAKAFAQLADGKSKDEQSESNIYYKSLSSQQLRDKAEEFRGKAAAIQL